MEKIKNNIFVETEFLGCNPSFVVTSCGVVMIDTPQKPSEAFQWKREIQLHGDVTYIINTDHHRDHAVGNYYFDADIIQHEGTLKKLKAPEYVDLCKQWIRLMDPPSDSFSEHYFVKTPKITYADKMTLYLGRDILELIRVKSHTEYETLIYMPEEGVLFTGDTVCTNGIPSLYESYPLDWLEALTFIETLDFDVLIPGHGRVGDRESVRALQYELNGLIERVKQTIEQGLRKEEIVEQIRYDDIVHSKYPPAFLPIFDRNMKRNIGRLYDVLMKP